MDLILERKVRVSTDSKLKNLYVWSITEVDDNDTKVSDDWIPFHWSLWFTATSVEVKTEISSGDELQDEVDLDNNKPFVSEKKFINGKLISGIPHDGGYVEDQVEYSMFGTTRLISEIYITIREAEEEEGENCTLLAIPSYEFESYDFQTSSQPDYMGFAIRIAKKKLNKLMSLVESKTVANIQLRVGFVDGIYTHWTPTTFARTAKVLSSEHSIENKEVVEFKVPCTGRVGEFDLTFTSKQDLVQVQEDEGADQVNELDQLALDSSAMNEHKIFKETKLTKDLETITKEIRSVKFLLGAVLIILTLMLVW